MADFGFVPEQIPFVGVCGKSRYLRICALKGTPITFCCNYSSYFLTLSLIAPALYDFFRGERILFISFIDIVHFSCQ